MVLPYIDMNQPWVYMCSPSWIPLPPRSCILTKPLDDSCACWSLRSTELASDSQPILLTCPPPPWAMAIHPWVHRTRTLFSYTPLLSSPPRERLHLLVWPGKLTTVSPSWHPNSAPQPSMSVTPTYLPGCWSAPLEAALVWLIPSPGSLPWPPLDSLGMFSH